MELRPALAAVGSGSEQWMDALCPQMSSRRRSHTTRPCHHFCTGLFYGQLLSAVARSFTLDSMSASSINKQTVGRALSSLG